MMDYTTFRAIQKAYDERRVYHNHSRVSSLIADEAIRCVRELMTRCYLCKMLNETKSKLPSFLTPKHLINPGYKLCPACLVVVEKIVPLLLQAHQSSTDDIYEMILKYTANQGSA
jgi:hypothetical protein